MDVGEEISVELKELGLASLALEWDAIFGRHLKLVVDNTTTACQTILEIGPSEVPPSS